MEGACPLPIKDLPIAKVSDFPILGDVINFATVVMNLLGQWMSDTKTTQKALASMLGVTQPTVSDWLKGENWPSVDNLRKLSEITGKSIDALVNDVEESPQAEPGEESFSLQPGDPTTTGTHG